MLRGSLSISGGSLLAGGSLSGFAFLFGIFVTKNLPIYIAMRHIDGHA